jgi:hypothetical protein
MNEEYRRHRDMRSIVNGNSAYKRMTNSVEGSMEFCIISKNTRKVKGALGV